MNANSCLNDNGKPANQIGNPPYGRSVAGTVSSRRARRREQGSAVLVVLALLAIILIYVAYNIRMLHLLREDVRTVEKQQLRRLSAACVKTNTVLKLDLPLPNSSTNAPVR